MYYLKKKGVSQSRELIPFSTHRPIDKTQIRPLIRVNIEIIRCYGALSAPDRINVKDGS
jgi:hypothetical protein